MVITKVTAKSLAKFTPNHYGWGNIDNLGKGEETFATSTKKEKRHCTKLGKVGCQLYDGPHLEKECPLNEDAKGVEEVKYGEPSLEELMNKHLEESAQRSFEMEEWIKKIQESTKIKTRNQGASLKNLETQIEQLTKEVHAKAAIEIPTSSVGQCKAVYKDAPINKASTNKTNEIHEVSFFDEEEDDNLVSEGLPCQLPPKEMNPGSFTLPYTIGSLDFYAMATRSYNENMILGRPFLATIHAEIDIFNKEISLRIRDDGIIFDMNKISYEFTTPIEKAYMVNVVHGKDLMDIDSDLFLYESESCEFNRLLTIDPDIFTCDIDIQESYEETIYRCCRSTQGEPEIKKRG
ncbi:hypothetical protein Tco_0989919 [Tanacetum coccineum]|uniref:Uncharacterized protein n=1 Tax=Tanacetum coccineum TaxID=301880 RepID=A0ABQ5EV67_9ASTR